MPPSPHLIKNLQVEGVHPRRHRALDHLVPSRVLGSVVSGWCLVDCIAQSDPTVRIHTGHTIVFSQLGLYNKTNKMASVRWYIQVGYISNVCVFSSEWLHLHAHNQKQVNGINLCPVLKTWLIPWSWLESVYLLVTGQYNRTHMTQVFVCTSIKLQVKTAALRLS